MLGWIDLLSLSKASTAQSESEEEKPANANLVPELLHITKIELKRLQDLNRNIVVAAFPSINFAKSSYCDFR
jgi:hypothetical protein